MAVSAPPETTLKVPRAPLGCLNEKLWLFKNNKTRQDRFRSCLGNIRSKITINEGNYYEKE